MHSKKKSDLLRCLTTAPRTDNQDLIGKEGFDDETDLVVCRQHFQKVKNSVDKLDTVEVDEYFLSVPEQPQAVDHLEPLTAFGTQVLDGSAVIHFLSTTGVDTFKYFANYVFLPYIKHHLENTEKVDFVLDSYISISFKEGTLDNRGKGLRRKVADSNKLPGKWQNFLKDSNNKHELFTFLSEKVTTAHFEEGKRLL